jgi:hypothetical protein
LDGDFGNWHGNRGDGVVDQNIDRTAQNLDGLRDHSGAGSLISEIGDDVADPSAVGLAYRLCLAQAAR